MNDTLTKLLQSASKSSFYGSSRNGLSGRGGIVTKTSKENSSFSLRLSESHTSVSRWNDSTKQRKTEEQNIRFFLEITRG